MPLKHLPRLAKLLPPPPSLWLPLSLPSPHHRGHEATPLTPTQTASWTITRCTALLWINTHHLLIITMMTPNFIETIVTWPKYHFFYFSFSKIGKVPGRKRRTVGTLPFPRNVGKILILKPDEIEKNRRAKFKVDNTEKIDTVPQQNHWSTFRTKSPSLPSSSSIVLKLSITKVFYPNPPFNLFHLHTRFHWTH